MKRTACLLLAAVLLAAAGFAGAKAGPVPVTQYIGESICADWAKILELDRKIDSDSSDDSVYQNLHSDNPPDFFVISSAELSRFLDEGFCAPFMPSEKMLDEIRAMPPFIQQALKESIYTEDGRLSAYPLSSHVSSMLFWVPEVWKESPFRDLTPPSSYAELLDFLEVYLDTPHDGYCFYYDIYDSKYPQMNWVSYLLKSSVLQCRYNHQDTALSNPVFISLLRRTIELANRLYEAEPNPKKQKGRQLFTEDKCGYTTNGQDQYTWKNIIPWRITADQQPLVNVIITLSCARNGSSFEGRTTELFDCFVDHRQDQVERYNHFLYLFLNRNWIDVDKENAKVLKKYGSKWKCLCLTQEYVDSIWEMGKYAVPCTIDEDYLYPSSWDVFDAYDQLTLQCINGDISAEDYAAEMDRLAAGGK